VLAERANNGLPAAVQQQLAGAIGARIEAGRTLSDVHLAAGTAGEADAVWCARLLGRIEDPPETYCSSTLHPEPTTLQAAVDTWRTERRARDGALTPRVWAKLREAPASPVEITLWPRLPPSPSRGEIDDPVVVARHRGYEEAVHARVESTLARVCPPRSDCEIVDRLGPYAHIRLPAAAVESVAFDPELSSVDLYVDAEHREQPGGIELEAVRFDDAQQWAPPLTGNGIKVAVLEQNRPHSDNAAIFTQLDFANDVYCAAEPTGWHTQMVTSVIAARADEGQDPNHRALDGSAPDCRLLAANYSLSCCPGCSDDRRRADAMEWARDERADVVNFSVWLNSGCAGGQSYFELARYFDWVSTQHPWPVITAIAGNWGRPAGVTNPIYNGINVGGSDDRETIGRSDDLLWGSGPCAYGNGASTVNPTTGLELPHVVAPARSISVVNQNPGDWTSRNGTSLAAAQLAGLAAAVLEGRPALKSYPEAVKAIIMATASKDVDGPSLNLSDAVDDGDGAGEINAVHAWLLTNYGSTNTWHPSVASEYGANYGLMTAADLSTGPRSVEFTAASATIQAAMAWEVGSSCSDPEVTCPPATEPNPYLSFSMVLWKWFGGWNAWLPVTLSVAPANHHNHLFVRYTGQPGDLYRISVYKEWESSASAAAYYGLAWSNPNDD
jgi:hypothetical protein